MKKILNKSKCFYSAAIMSIMLLACVLSVQPAYATSFDWAVALESAPVAVSGRTLSGFLAGDPKSDWLEIAQNGRYSLIIRKNYINWYPSAARYGVLTYQSPSYGSHIHEGNIERFFGRIFSKSEYSYSNVRNYINKWFIGSANPAADNLPANARMRNYTMYSNAIGKIGSSCRTWSLTDGLSKPTPYQVGTGNDVAFALSFSEAANFCSLTYHSYSVPVGTNPSPAAAISNFNQMVIHKPYGMWLRSPSDQLGETMLNAISTLSNAGRVFQNYKLGDTHLIYPAVWVDQDIFDPNSNRTRVHVTGTVAANSVRSNRILPARMTGDNSDWIEIANYQGYSLIVRANFINTYHWQYGQLLWQAISYGPYDDNYMDSYVRDYINNWYNHSMYFLTNGTLPDLLPKDARLRRFAVYSNVAGDDNVLGTSCHATSLLDGFSTPTSYSLGVGDDVAFALSFSEAAAFCSTNAHLYSDIIGTPPKVTSVIAAQNNYMKFVKPPVVNKYSIWLRSRGYNTYDEDNYAGSLDGYTDGVNDMTGVVWHNYVGSVNNRYSFPHPAMWVGQGIFEEDPSVTYKPNGGVGADVVDSVLLYNSYKIKDNPGYYRNNHDFVCWNDKADGTGEEFWPNDSITITRSLTLYAQWAHDPVKVTYYPNGGVGNPKEVIIGYDSIYRIQNQGYYRQDYDFAGWNTNPNGTGNRYEDGNDVRMLADLTLYAQWVNKPVTVTYYPNNGIGNINKYVVQYGSNYTIQNQGYTRDGYYFKNWNTVAGGTGTTYTDGQTVYNITSDLNLYAQWDNIPSARVTYLPNGATVGSPIYYDVKIGDFHTIIQNPSYEKTGYVFNGWNDRSNGSGASYTIGYSQYIGSDLTLYAQWIAEPRTVTYNPNNGVGSPRVDNVFYDDSYQIDGPAYYRDGYSFNEWNTMADGSGTKYTNGQWTVIKDSLVLYAQWKANSLTVTYEPNGGSGNRNEVDVNYDMKYTIVDQGYSRFGYHQNGWNSMPNGTGTSYTNDQDVIIKGSIVLYAQWEANSYTLTYHPNGGVGDIKYVTVYHGNTHTVVDQGYTYSDHIQRGWNTRADGLGDTYANGQILTIQSSVTLYAQWKPVVTVTYYPNSGVGSIVRVSEDFGSIHTVRDQSYTKTGYTQNGWNTKADGTGVKYSNGDGVTILNSLELYAQWEPKQLTVTYHPNEGEGNTVIAHAVYDQDYKFVDQGYTRELFEFECWSTHANGLGTQFSIGEVLKMTDDIVVYAIWKPVVEKMTKISGY